MDHPKEQTHPRPKIQMEELFGISKQPDEERRPPPLLLWRSGSKSSKLGSWSTKKYPNIRIFAKKNDIKAAYHCLHLNHKTSHQRCTQVPEESLALMMLQLTFGGSPCPNEFSVVSETICNLATVIISHNNWDPDELHAPAQENLPPPIFLPDNIPFGEGRELIVNIKTNPCGTQDINVNNLIGLGLDLPSSNNIKQSEQAPLLAIDACSQQLHNKEPIPCHKMAARHKLWAEGWLEETTMISGWLWDFLRLTISPQQQMYCMDGGNKQHDK
jgi:hypothetical protein